MLKPLRVHAQEVEDALSRREEYGVWKSIILPIRVKYSKFRSLKDDGLSIINEGNFCQFDVFPPKKTVYLQWIINVVFYLYCKAN